MLNNFVLQFSEKVTYSDYAGCEFFDTQYIELRSDYYNYVTLVSKYGSLSDSEVVLCNSIENMIKHLDYMCELEPFVMGEPHQYKENHVSFEDFVAECELEDLEVEATSDEILDLMLDIEDFDWLEV